MRATLSYILLWTTYLLATAEVKLLVNLVEARWGQIDGVFGPRVILGGVGFFYSCEGAKFPKSLCTLSQEPHIQQHSFNVQIKKTTKVRALRFDLSHLRLGYTQMGLCKTVFILIFFILTHF